MAIASARLRVPRNPKAQAGDLRRQMHVCGGERVAAIFGELDFETNSGKLSLVGAQLRRRGSALLGRPSAPLGIRFCLQLGHRRPPGIALAFLAPKSHPRHYRPLRMDMMDAGVAELDFPADEGLASASVGDSVVTDGDAVGSESGAPEKAKAKGRKQHGSGAGVANKKPQRMCLICRDTSASLWGNNPVCHTCKAEHDAMKKFAVANGCAARFAEGKSTSDMFRKMVNDFTHSCASRGRGRSRPTYNTTRLEDIFEQPSVLQNGNEYAIMDWFEFESWYGQKKFNDDAIEQKWRDALASTDPRAIDHEGENLAYPERAQVLVKAFRKVYDEEATCRRAVRAGPNLKKAVGDEDFGALQDEVWDMQCDQSDGAFGPAQKRPRVGESLGATPLGKKPAPRADLGAAVGVSPDKDAGDIGTARLRAHERWEDTFSMRVKPLLKAATARVVRHSPRSDPRDAFSPALFRVRALAAHSSSSEP